MQTYDLETENARLVGILERLTGLRNKSISGSPQYSLSINDNAKQVLSAFFPEPNKVDINTIIYEYSQDRPYQHELTFQYEGAIWKLRFGKEKDVVFEHFGIHPCESCFISIDAKYDRDAGMYLCESCEIGVKEDQWEQRMNNAGFDESR